MPALASMMPVTPPSVNKKIKPIAHSIGTRNWIEPPHMVAIQEKIFTPVDTHARHEHVMRPNDEADEADRHHGVGHAEVTEHRLAREGGNDVTDHAEARQDQDIDLRVPEEPEQMLIEQGVTAARR